MKVLLFALAFLIPVGCAADNHHYRHHHDDSGNYQERHTFWNQIDRRLARQYHRIEEGLEHGRLNPHHAHRLSRNLRRLENRIAALRYRNRWSYRQKRHILERLERNQHALENHLHRDRPAHRYQRRPYGTGNYRPNVYLDDSGIRWSSGDSFGSFYFRF